MEPTINFTLSESLNKFVESQVESGDFGTPGQYLRELIAEDRYRRARNLEDRLLDAASQKDRGIRIPDEICEGGDIVAFCEQHAKKLF